MAEATIRPRRDEDLPELACILVEVHAHDGYPVEGVADPEAWLHLAKPIGAWVAELDGQPVGHAACTEPGASDTAARMLHEQRGVPYDRIAVLGRLFIAPKARGRHLGIQLVHMAAKAAYESNRSAVFDVMVKDKVAIAMYEKLGCEPLGNFLHQHPNGQEPATAFVLPTAPTSAWIP